jgi:outer membrane lipoprotein-sorting protein
MKNAAFPNPFMNYKETGATVELGGTEKIGERDAYLLIFKPKTGAPVRQYVDAASYLPVRVVVKLDVPQVGELEQTTDLLDYREVDGYKVPFQVKSISRVQTSIINITKVEHNITIDQTLFAKPAAGQ